MILDEFANVVTENPYSKRKRHQAKMLHRRNTLLQGPDLSPTGDSTESDSSEEILVEKVCIRVFILSTLFGKKII